MSYIAEFVNHIIGGDCTTVMREIPAGGVDFVLTDPPYLIDYRDRSGRRVTNDADGSWVKPAFAQIYRVLKPHAFCVSFYAWNRVHTFMAAWRAVGFRPVGHLVWAKRYASSEAFVRYTHESAYLLAKGDPPKPKHLISDVLDWHYTGNYYHPTEKSPAALTPVILAFSKPGDIVLDPFAGTGSTAVAAHHLRRRYIGIELDGKYCEAARKRLKRP